MLVYSLSKLLSRMKISLPLITTIDILALWRKHKKETLDLKNNSYSYTVGFLEIMQCLQSFCNTLLTLLREAEICAVKRFSCKFDKITAMCLYMIFPTTQFVCTLFETI